MIQSLELKNFKCFDQLKLQLAKMNILAGSNAAGKSSVIQALLLADATSREKGDSVDATEALGVAVGNPRALIAQNRQELAEGDFSLHVRRGETEVSYIYRIDRLNSLKLSYTQTKDVPGDRLFYLNAERLGPRISYPAGEDEGILRDGSNAAYLIDRADLQRREVPDCLMLEEGKSRFSIQVENWMNLILGDVSFSVSTDYVRAATDIRYGNGLAEEPVLPTMTGFGISYILSVVTAGLWCASLRNTTLMIENPEAHLHPAAQSRMGKFLELLTEAGVQLIVETHSEHIIDGARVQAAVMRQTDQMHIWFFSKEADRIQVDQIDVNEYGELSEWPKGFFDQKEQDLRDLFYMRRTHADHK